MSLDVSRSGVLCVVALLLVSNPLVDAYASGAPISNCKSDKPGHGEYRNIGYTIEVDITNVRPGQLVTVTVSNGTWQGIRLQALAADGTPFGQFSGFPEGLKTISCSNNADTITQTSQTNRGRTSFKWQAPSSVDRQMQVTIKGPILLGFGTYDLVSSPLITIAPGSSTENSSVATPKSTTLPPNSGNKTPVENDGSRETGDGNEDSHEITDNQKPKNGKESLNSSTKWFLTLLGSGLATYFY